MNRKKELTILVASITKFGESPLFSESELKVLSDLICNLKHKAEPCFDELGNINVAKFPDAW